MAVDYEKLVNLDYTAYEHSLDFQEKLRERGITLPSIETEKIYGDVPEVEVTARDMFKQTKYVETYRLEGVTREEFDEVMFDIWELAMTELEP